MAEERTYQGHTYRRNSPSEPWVLVGPAQRGVVIADPYRQAEEGRKAEDQQLDRERVDISRAALDVSQQNANKPPAGFERGPDGTLRFIPGGPADPAVIAANEAVKGQRMTSEDRTKALTSYNQIANLAEGVNNLRQQYEEHYKGRNPFEGIGMTPGVGKFLRPEDRIFTDTSNSQIAYIAAALGLSGQQFNTPAEQKLFIEGILPKPGDTDGQIEAKLNRLDVMIRNARTNGRAMLGFTDDNDPLLSNQSFTDYLGRTGGGDGDGSIPPAAGGGATQQSVPVPEEMQAENAAWLRDNLMAGDAGAYAKFRQELDRKYGFQPAAEGDLRQWFEGARKAASQGGQPPVGIPPANQELSGFEKLRNDVVSNPFGSFVASAANAGGLGLPTLLARDETEAMRELNPTSSLLGDIAGGVTGTSLLGKGAGMLASKATNPNIAALLANPLTADMAYGTLYGATQAEDPLYGAAGGATGAFLGNRLGNAAGKLVPRAFGVSRPDDVLSGGERRLFVAVNRTGVDPVVEALRKADELGVPAAIADVSPDANSLTGAALRRSPTAAGDARVTLGDRSRGQYDRFLGAVERDLGPIASVPQRSEDLIQSARAAAGPHYDRAYAAPGAENVDLSDLADRPTFAAALREAYNEMLDEGLDPSAMGLQQVNDQIAVASPSWQTLDYVKRGLDNVIERNTSKIDGVGPDARRAIEMKNALLGRMDELNPDYAAARAAYSGPAQERAALQAGREAISSPPDRLAFDVSRASPANADQMRLGFQSGLGEQAGRLRQGTNPFESVLGTPAMEQRLATLYPEGGDNIARLLAQRDMERQLAGSTNRLIGNSMTAERGLADEAFSQSSLMGDMVQGAAETMVTGAPTATVLRSGIGRGLGPALRDWRTLGLGKKATALADEIAPLALNIDPAASADSLLDIAARDAAYQEIIDALLKDAAVRGGHAGAGAGSAVSAALLR